jgi:IS5 family transposase
MINPSDPDVSWGAKTKDKFFAGYKTMINTDHKYGLVTEAETEKAGHPEEKSAAQLLQQQKNNLGIVPEHFTADAKYDTGNTRAEIKAVADPGQNINLYIPLIPTKNKTGGYLPDQFFFEDYHLFCPAGYPAAYSHPDELKLGFEYKFEPSVCAKCVLRSECTTAKSGRRVFISHTQLEREITKTFNASDQFEIMYKEQHWKIEPKNSDLKNNQGLSRARYRGLSRVRIQVYLAVIANNLKKYCKIIAGKIKEGVTNTLAKVIALGPPGGRVCPNTT